MARPTCTKCHRPYQAKTYRRCPRCRAVAGANQRRRRAVRMVEGRCIVCGRSLGAYRSSCDVCVVKARLLKRRELDLKSWRAGGPGRKPFLMETTAAAAEPDAYQHAEWCDREQAWCTCRGGGRDG